MKYRGKEYENDIEELKKIKLIDIVGYQDKMDEICRKYKISIKTVYRDMRKKIPGLRKPRNDVGRFRTKISTEEQNGISELLKAGKTKKEALKIMSDKLNQKISNRKGKRIKPDGSAGGDSMFGEKAKQLFETLFEFDLIAPDQGIKLEYGGFKFHVQKSDLSDIILILSNAYNRTSSPDKKMKLDRSELRKMMMYQLLDEQMVLAKASGDTKILNTISQILDRLEPDYQSLSPNFKAVEKICKQLKPDISFDEIIALIQKYA